MRIVCLENFLAELVQSIGLGDSLVGVPAGAKLRKELVSVARVAGGESAAGNAVWSDRSFCSFDVNLNALAAAEPDLVLASIDAEDDALVEKIRSRQEELSGAIGRPLKLCSYKPRTLEGIYEMLRQMGKDLGKPEAGRDLSQKLKAQFMDWADNFYDRMHSKRVTFISSIEPLQLGGRWIPDMIRLCSAEPQFWQPGKESQSVEWREVAAFRPDVILVAPREMDGIESRKSFAYFHKLPGFEELPAAKRGEVYFCGGKEYFHTPTMGLIDSMAVLVSAISGFESGYITPRDSFFKLRWLELQRHRL